MMINLMQTPQFSVNQNKPNFLNQDMNQNAPTQSLLTNLFQLSLKKQQNINSLDQFSQENLSNSTTCDSDNDSMSSTPIKNMDSVLQKSSSFQKKRVQTAQQILPQLNMHQNQQMQMQQLAVLKNDSQQNYKTEICRNWQQQGNCQYGKKCRYAHGHEELNSKQNMSEFYKTRECKLFHQDGYCSYGVRCHFIHVNKTQADILGDSKVGFWHRLNVGIIQAKPKSRFDFVENSDKKTQQSTKQQQQQQYEPQSYQEFQQLQMLQQFTSMQKKLYKQRQMEQSIMSPVFLNNQNLDVHNQFCYVQSN